MTENSAQLLLYLYFTFCTSIVLIHRLGNEGCGHHFEQVNWNNTGIVKNKLKLNLLSSSDSDFNRTGWVLKVASPFSF